MRKITKVVIKYQDGKYIEEKTFYPSENPYYGTVFYSIKVGKQVSKFPYTKILSIVETEI